MNNNFFFLLPIYDQDYDFIKICQIECYQELIIEFSLLSTLGAMGSHNRTV